MDSIVKAIDDLLAKTKGADNRSDGDVDFGGDLMSNANLQIRSLLRTVRVVLREEVPKYPAPQSSYISPGHDSCDERDLASAVRSALALVNEVASLPHSSDVAEVRLQFLRAAKSINDDLASFIEGARRESPTRPAKCMRISSPAGKSPASSGEPVIRYLFFSSLYPSSPFLHATNFMFWNRNQSSMLGMVTNFCMRRSRR